jgi:CDP-6-deoxy-D-xylo-4-hexulose-3-dehydrase
VEIEVGDVWLSAVAYTDKSGEKIRPVVIVEKIYHDDYIYIPLTSNLKQQRESEIVLDTDDVATGKIIKSKALLHKSCVINSKLLQKKIARLNKEAISKVLKGYIFYKTKHYYQTIHKTVQELPFMPGKSKINYAGRIFDEKELINLVDSSLDFWLTTGKYTEKFEEEFPKFLGVKYCSLVNSGSSANLLAFMALTSQELGERRIKKGDEVITVAAGFPTTVAPIIQYGAMPVFVDITLPTYNIDCSQLEEALSDKTKAVMIAHTLGNPFDVKTIKDFCSKHNLWLIEDNCDALGSRYRRWERVKARKGEREKGRKGKSEIGRLDEEWGYTGTFGQIGTSSFYPSHHMTMGEGGAVYTNDIQLKRIVDSLRDWGRDCWCPSGHDNTCRKRFDWKLGELPHGYDHKYIYSHFGYNLKVTDMQAAIGCAQLEKLPSFIEARKKNWKLLRDGLSNLSDRFILPEPTPDSDPSWFGFLLTVRKNAGFTRDEILNHLETNGIQTRMLFAGNLIKHPCFDEMRKNRQGFRVVSALPNTDRVMMDAFWIGVYPGMREEMLLYTIEKIKEFVISRA